jgi:hypothetical protein
MHILKEADVLMFSRQTQNLEYKYRIYFCHNSVLYRYATKNGKVGHVLN